MNINIKGNISVTPAISDYLDSRLEKIKKIIGDDPAIQCDVELSRTTVHHAKGDIFKAEIHIVGSGRNIFGRSEKQDLYGAIDVVQNQILSELKSEKGKKISFVRRGGAQVKSMMKGLWPWGQK